MPDMYSEEEQNVALGETISDIEVELPFESLSITISRLKDEDGIYVTKIWTSRKVRRLYALGLLSEAASMITSTNAEVAWCSDTPGCMPEGAEP